MIHHAFRNLKGFKGFNGQSLKVFLCIRTGLVGTFEIFLVNSISYEVQHVDTWVK